jgi:hypothetical protein
LSTDLLASPTLRKSSLPKQVGDKVRARNLELRCSLLRAETSFVYARSRVFVVVVFFLFFFILFFIGKGVWGRTLFSFLFSAFLSVQIACF